MNELAPHELCTDFRIQHPTMADKEVAYFNEAFSHFHKIMTDANGQWLYNAQYLNENFFLLWNNNEPQEMLNLCLEHAMMRLTYITPEQLNNQPLDFENSDDINKENKD